MTGNRLSPAQWKFLEEQAFTGYDNDANMVKIAILNLYLHRLEKAHVEFHNPLTTGKGAGYPGLTFDVILANPPFAGKVQAESILSDLNHGLNTRATELLFVRWFLDHLSSQGRAGIIVPEGVVVGTDNASRKVRRALLEQNRLEAVVSLPPSTFRPYAKVATFVLVFLQGGRTERTWMYQLSSDGLSQDAIRAPVPENDIPDLLSQWQNRNGSDYRALPGKHGWVDVARMVDADYALAPRLYLQPSVIEHQYPTAHIKDLCNLHKGTVSAQRASPGAFPLVTTAEELKTSDQPDFEGEAICVPLVSSTGHGHASMKRITFMRGRFAAATIVAVLKVKDERALLPQFLYYYLDAHKDELLVPLMKGTANVALSLERIGAVHVPVPPPDVQRALIEQLVTVEREIEHLKTREKELQARKRESMLAFKSEFAQQTGGREAG